MYLSCNIGLKSVPLQRIKPIKTLALPQSTENVQFSIKCVNIQVK